MSASRPRPKRMIVAAISDDDSDGSPSTAAPKLVAPNSPSRPAKRARRDAVHSPSESVEEDDTPADAPAKAAEESSADEDEEEVEEPIGPECSKCKEAMRQRESHSDKNPNRLFWICCNQFLWDDEYEARLRAAKLKLSWRCKFCRHRLEPQIASVTAKNPGRAYVKCECSRNAFAWIKIERKAPARARGSRRILHPSTMGAYIGEDSDGGKESDESDDSCVVDDDAPLEYDTDDGDSLPDPDNFEADDAAEKEAAIKSRSRVFSKPVSSASDDSDIEVISKPGLSSSRKPSKPVAPISDEDSDASLPDDG